MQIKLLIRMAMNMGVYEKENYEETLRWNRRTIKQGLVLKFKNVP